MQEIAGKLGFKDVLAYVMPGLLGLSGLVLVVDRVSVGKYRGSLPNTTAGQWWLAALVLAAAYGIGLMSSAFIQLVDDRLTRSFRSGPLDRMIEELQAPLADAYKTFWGKELPSIKQASDVWKTPFVYYACRAAIREDMPVARRKIDRASSLRQARRNMIIPSVLFSVGILAWATKSSLEWPVRGVALVFGVVGGTATLYGLTRGMAISRQREMQETFLSFCVAHKRGLFASPPKPNNDEDKPD